MSRKSQRMRILDYEDDYEDYDYDDYDDEDDDLDYDDDPYYDDLEEEDIDFDDDEDDGYPYDDDEDDEEEVRPRRRRRRRSASRSQSRSKSRSSRTRRTRSKRKASRPSKETGNKSGNKGSARASQPEGKSTSSKSKNAAKPKRKGRVPIAILSFLFVGALIYSAVVVMKNNELQSQGAVIQAENNLMAEKLESAGLNPNVLPFQDGADEDVTAKPYVLTIWGVEPVITTTGSTMDVSVRANVLNDSPRVLGNDDVPQLTCGGQFFPGTIEGDSIPAFHGEGTVVWRATGVPIETADFSLTYDEQHLVYYIEKISDAVAAKKIETFGI